MIDRFLIYFSRFQAFIVGMYYDLFPGQPWEVAVDMEEGIFTQEEMVYLDSDTESESDVEEIDHEGSWANPIDLTLDTDDEGSTDEEFYSDEDELYLD